MGGADSVAREVVVVTSDAALPGSLATPVGARAVVLFAHGSGSSRFSQRNRFVAGELNGSGLGTLLFDLLTPEEQVLDEQTAELRFDIPLLSRRLAGAVDWLHAQPEFAASGIGLFGASTGAAAALNVAAERREIVGAVVSRGGRPDLAADALDRVAAPTLLIVGGLDTVVIDLNRAAAARLRGERQMAIVSGATHLFAEPGTLEEVARLAGDWFARHLCG